METPIAYRDVGKGREHDCMDAGGTTPRMGEVELRREQQSRAMQEQLPRSGSFCPACGCSLVRLGILKEKAVQHNYAGKQYWFCCQGCLELFITYPESCLDETAGLTVCPVCLAEKPLNATVAIDFNGKPFMFCRCPHCLDPFNKDPHYFIARLAWQTNYAGVFGENIGCCSK